MICLVDCLPMPIYCLQLHSRLCNISSSHKQKLVCQLSFVFLECGDAKQSVSVTEYIKICCVSGLVKCCDRASGVKVVLDACYND